MPTVRSLGLIQGSGEHVQDLDCCTLALLGPTGYYGLRHGFEPRDKRFGHAASSRTQLDDRHAAILIVPSALEQAVFSSAIDETTDIRSVASKRLGEIAYGQGTQGGTE